MPASLARRLRAYLSDAALLHVAGDDEAALLQQLPPRLRGALLQARYAPLLASLPAVGPGKAAAFVEDLAGLAQVQVLAQGGCLAG